MILRQFLHTSPVIAASYVLGAAGALALGFLAMSYVTGDAAMRRRDLAASFTTSPVLQYLLIGLSLYFALWMLGGAFSWAGVLGGLVRLLAAVVTWVAVTVGFGAVLLTRAGTRTPRGPSRRLTTTTEEYAWQTPTPVTGVAAARRPTPASRSPER